MKRRLKPDSEAKNDELRRLLVVWQKAVRDSPEWHDAFAAIHKLAARRVFLTLKSFGLDDDLSADITQEVFLRLYEKIETVEGDKFTVGWLCMVARHLFFDQWRARKRERAATVEFDPDNDRHQRAAGETPGHSQSGKRIKDAIETVEQAFRTLSPNEDRAADLYSISGRVESAEAVKQLGWSNRQGRRHRANLRHKLRSHNGIAEAAVILGIDLTARTHRREN